MDIILASILGGVGFLISQNQTKKKSITKKNTDIDIANAENETLRDSEMKKDDDNKHSEEKTGWWS